MDAGQTAVTRCGPQLDPAVKVIALQRLLEVGAGLVRCRGDHLQVSLALDSCPEDGDELTSIAMDVAA